MAGRVNSLAQTLLKYTVPGVPDLYQGGELWDLSLVDPDNRRPVDYALRMRLLNEVRTKMCAKCAMGRMDEGVPKLWVIHHALKLRKEHPEWFGVDADYVPLSSEGKKAEHVIAFRRGDNLVSVVTRHWQTLEGDWDGTSLRIPEGRWTNRLTGDMVQGGAVFMKDLLAKFPVALLAREA